MEYRDFIASGGAGRLTREQECELFARIEAGVVAAAVLDGRLRSRTDASVAELERIAADGRSARERLWQASLAIALKIAGDLGRSWSGASEDLVQAACVGLAEAVMRFDCRREVRFSTFAWSAIRRRVGEELMRGDSARPVWRRRTERMVEDRELLLTMEMGRWVDDADIAAALDVEVSWVRARRRCGSDVSIGEPWVLEGLMPEAEEPDQDPEWLVEALAGLPGLQRRIIGSRYGFEGEAVPRHELAAELGLSDRAVRRMERSALDLLRGLAADRRDAA